MSERRLMIRPGAVGDCIVSLPAMERLRAPYTEVWVARANMPLVRFADRVRAIASTGLDLLELGLAPPTLLHELSTFDDIVSWYGAARPEFRAALSGLPARFFSALPAASESHAVDFYLQQVGAPTGAAPRIVVPSTRAAGYVVIHPFSGSPAKNWPLEKYRELARMLSRRRPVYWTAGPEETLEEAVRFDDLYELGCWIAAAGLYVGNDSGIAHLAAAVGAPAVALFGISDPAVWGPRGERVRVLRRQPIESLPVAEVMGACEEMARND